MGRVWSWRYGPRLALSVSYEGLCMDGGLLVLFALEEGALIFLFSLVHVLRLIQTLAVFNLTLPLLSRLHFELQQHTQLTV